jgi:hypothetical protein
VRNPTDLALFEGTLYWLKAGTGELTSYKLYGPYARRIGKLQLYLYNTEHFAILQTSAQPRGKVFIELDGLELDTCGWCIRYGLPSILSLYLYLTCSISYGVNLYSDLWNANKLKLKYRNTEYLKHNWCNK